MDSSPYLLVLLHEKTVFRYFLSKKTAANHTQCLQRSTFTIFPMPFSAYALVFCPNPLRSSTRRIFPLMVLGSSSTNSMTRGYL